MRALNCDILTGRHSLVFTPGGGITYCNSANYILERWRSAAAGCLSAYRPCNSPAGGVRATAISSGHRVRRCGHFGLTCRRNPTHNALCGTLTPQVIFTKPESLAVAMLPPLADCMSLNRTSLRSPSHCAPLVGPSRY